jgi:oligopeptide transport system permease protein
VRYRSDGPGPLYPESCTDARISITIGVVAAAINFVIGVLYGGISGYVGGKTDMIMMRVVDILISLPSMLYIVLIMLVLGSSVVSVIIALCFTSWIGTARVVRSEVMHSSIPEYVLAARLSGPGFGRHSGHPPDPQRTWVPSSCPPLFMIPGAIFSRHSCRSWASAFRRPWRVGHLGQRRALDASDLIPTR